MPLSGRAITRFFQSLAACGGMVLVAGQPAAQAKCLVQLAKLTASDAAAQDGFGNGVGLSSTASAGAQNDGAGGASNVGSAYVFDLTCDADGDGLPDGSDVCPDNDPDLPVDCNGRPLRDCNEDYLLDGEDIDRFVAELLG